MTGRMNISKFRRFRRHGAWCALTAALFTLAGAAVPAQADTLLSVVQEALDSNPELNAIRFNRQAIDQELRAARGLGLPTLDLKGDYGRHRHSLKAHHGIETTSDWHLHRELSLIMSQRIFDGFERSYEVARQKNRVESARWRVADTANSIALRAVQGYLETQRAVLVLKAARSNLTALRRLRARVRQRVKAGYGNEAENSEAGTRVANGVALVAEATARLADAHALFRAVVGRAPGRLARAKVPVRALPATVDAAVTAAIQAAPSVIATEHDAVAAEASVGSAYSRLYPKLNLELSTHHSNGNSVSGDRDIDARAMLVVRWNIFNGGIDRARIREARARANEAAEISANTRRVVERETRVSWHAITSARTRVPALARELDLARRTRRIYSAQFDTGGRRLLDLLDAQTEIFVAEAALRTEQFVGTFNTFRVLAAMGRLAYALGARLPAEAVEPHRQWVTDNWQPRWVTRVYPQVLPPPGK